MVHIKPIADFNLHWAKQFSNFFDVQNYDVPGYALPVLKMDLNIHMENLLLAYDHSSIIESSPMELRYILKEFLLYYFIKELLLLRIFTLIYLALFWDQHI